MDLNKKIYTASEIEIILKKLAVAEQMGLIEALRENNQYLMRSYAGRGKISNKWNIKIYAYSINKKGHSLICTDSEVLKNFLEDKFDFTPPDLKVLKIDDAGWGFPLCGVMVGVTDETDIYVDVVAVKYFQGELFSKKSYLKVYTKLGLKLISEKFSAAPDTHRIEICSGFVNQMLRDELRKAGFHVRIVEITGMLQRELEERFRLYVSKELNYDIYYDPKEMEKTDLPKKFAEVLDYGRKHHPEKLKTGWKSIGGL